MIELTGPEGRIVETALSLAKSKPWHDIVLLDIAEGCGMSLNELRDHVSSKAEILAAFTRAVDDAVIARSPKRVEGETARDRLFEVVMNRFDAMAPYKDALKSVAAAGWPDPAQLRAVMVSQQWMLQAAAIPTDGADGYLRSIGLASIYAAVFKTWLDDDDAGLARTMAALDRRLRRGEAALSRLEDLRAGAGDVVARLRGLIGGASRRDKTAKSDPPSDRPPASTAPADPI